MSTGELLALGAIAGATIFLGLPMGRMRRPRPALQAFLNAAAIGILTFLLYDVLAHAVEPVNGALTRAHSGHGSWWRFTGLVSTFTVALGVGLLSLVYFDRWRSRRVAVNAPGSASGVEADIETLEGAEEATVPTRPFGPGAAAVEELSPDRAGHHLSPAATVHPPEGTLRLWRRCRHRARNERSFRAAGGRAVCCASIPGGRSPATSA